MKRHRKYYLFSIIGISLCTFSIYASLPIRTIHPLVQWELQPNNPLVDALVPSRPVISGFSLTSIAADAGGNFYLIVRKQHALYIVTLNKEGKEIKRFPLRRKDGRAVRDENEYFSVNESGTRFWILRRPAEDMVGRYRWRIPYRILAVYDETGRLLQEWKHSDGEIALQAIGNEGAYVPQEGRQTSIYRIGVNQPLLVDLQLNYSSYLNSQGQCWDIGMKHTEEDFSASETREFTISVKEIGRKPRIIYTYTNVPFELPKEIFWQENDSDLFFSTYQAEKDGSIRSYFPIVYRASPQGIQRLFDSSALFETNDKKKITVGKLIKADVGGTVWMEAKLSNAIDKTSEYRIVKVQLMPRWRTWIK